MEASAGDLSVTPVDDISVVLKATNLDEAQVVAEPTDPNFSIKHPLQHRWTLWYDSPAKKTSQASWADNLKKIVTFDTVEDFWRIFNNIRPASKLGSGSNYHLFKEDIEPMWEHHENVKGGKWIASVKGRDTTLDQQWLWLLLACIGENLEDDDVNEVCGCVVSIRQGQNRLALWTKTATAADVTKRIGSKLRKAIELPLNVGLGYQCHADSKKNNSSFNNRNKYEC